MGKKRKQQQQPKTAVDESVQAAHPPAPAEEEEGAEELHESQPQETNPAATPQTVVDDGSSDTNRIADKTTGGVERTTKEKAATDDQLFSRASSRKEERRVRVVSPISRESMGEKEDSFAAKELIVDAAASTGKEQLKEGGDGPSTSSYDASQSAVTLPEFGRTAVTELWDDGELEEEEDEEFSEWFFRCLWAMIRIAIPVSFSVSLTNAAFVFTISYAAHTLERLEFAGLAMGLSFSNITANSLGAGLSCALDTLCSQEHGRDPKSKRIGLYLQRAFIATFGLFIPLSVLYCFSEPVLAAVIKPDIAYYAAYWLKYSVVISLPTVLTTCLQKYVQCHGDSTIVLYSSILGTVSVPFFLTHLSGYGLPGFILALCLNRSSVLLCLIIFSMRKPELQATWPGWTSRCLKYRAMRRYFIVGLPSMAAFCADLWGFEAMAVMAGHLGSLEVAIWMIVINIQGLCWGPCVGICSSAAVRVGNALGAGKPKEAQRMLRGAIVLSLLIGTFCGGITIVFGKNILRLLQKDPQVIAGALKVLTFNGCALFLDIQFYVLQGIYRGCGKQNLAAIFVAVGHWCVGIPLSGILALVYNYEVRGILIGFIVGMLAVIPVFLYHLFFKFDWAAMAKEISVGPLIRSAAIGSEGASSSQPDGCVQQQEEGLPTEKTQLLKLDLGSGENPKTSGYGSTAAAHASNNERDPITPSARLDSTGSLGSAPNSASSIRPRRSSRFERNDSGSALISPSLGPAASETLHGSGTGSIALGGSTRGLSSSLSGMPNARGGAEGGDTFFDDGDTPRTFTTSGPGSKPGFPDS